MFIQIKDLCFKYNSTNNETIHHFNLTIEKGEIISLLGESGSGKSTMLRLLSGLETPKSGSILINDEILSDDAHFVLPEKRGVGMVFQDHALFPHMTVADNVAFGLKKYKSKEKKNRVHDVLDLVRMNDYKKRYPHELSGGQQQRIALARALAPKPSLLLLDEPFSHLDADLQIKIRNELKKILKASGTTSIFVTHDYKDSQAIADRIFTLRDGEAYEWKSICTQYTINQTGERRGELKMNE